MGDNNGSSGNARMTEAEWVEAADKICAEFGAELEGLPEPESMEDLGTLADAGTADRRGRRRDGCAT